MLKWISNRCGIDYGSTAVYYKQENFDEINTLNRNAFLLSSYDTLKGLRLYKTKCRLISFINSFQSLRSISITHSDIRSIPVIKIKNLRSLNLSKNSIKKIEGLDKLRYLQYLDLSGNAINKIQGLEKNKRLIKLKLKDNYISKIEGLKHIRGILSIDLSENKIIKIHDLTEVSNCMSLSLSGNFIEKEPRKYLHFNDLKSLAKLDNIKILKLRWNRLRDVSPLKKMKRLAVLDLTGNKISTLENIFDIKALYILNLSGNPIISKLNRTFDTKDTKEEKKMLKVMKQKGINIILYN